MKKMATKFTAAVLAGTLIGSLSMGTVFAEETGVTPMSDLEIGVVIYSVEDTLGKGSKMVLDMAAEALNVKLNYAVGSLDPDSQIADVENLISAGVDGIIILNLSDQMMPVICDLCEDSETPVAMMFRRIGDDEIREECYEYDYYVGWTTDDDYGAGRIQAQSLVDSGATEVGCMFAASGTNPSIDDRQRGVREVLDENGISYHEAVPAANTASDYSDTYANLYSAHKIDGIVATASAFGMADVAISYFSDKDVKFTGYSIPGDYVNGWNNGTLSLLCAGNHVDPLYSLIAVYDFIHGVPMQAESGKFEASTNWVFLESLEDTENFVNNMQNQFNIYTADDIRNATTVYNPDMTYEKFINEFVKGYGIDLIK